MKKPAVFLMLFAVVALGGAAFAFADSVGPITFEPPTYAVANIDGQAGWTNTGSYDSAVVATSSFPAAVGYGFGTQSLRISSAKTSGSFGDQTFAPPLASPAGESTSLNHFDASFSIGTAVATEQPGLQLSVSPDDGTGGRMSYLRFADEADGVHVFFDDATDAGPVGTTATFNESDIATLSRGTAHTVMFSMTFVPGPNNDVVQIFIDGKLVHTGGSWEDYYRYDPEQTPAGNVVPVTKTLLFREGPWAPVASTLNNGFLIDNVSIASSQVSVPTTGGKAACKKGGWRTFPGATFKNQGQCIKAFNKSFHAAAAKGHHGDDNSQGNDSNSQGKGDTGGMGKGHQHGNAHVAAHGNAKGNDR
jgi:hypothetical protein